MIPETHLLQNLPNKTIILRGSIIQLKEDNETSPNKNGMLFEMEVWLFGLVIQKIGLTRALEMPPSIYYCIKTFTGMVPFVLIAFERNKPFLKQKNKKIFNLNKSSSYFTKPKYFS